MKISELIQQLQEYPDDYNKITKVHIMTTNTEVPLYTANTLIGSTTFKGAEEKTKYDAILSLHSFLVNNWVINFFDHEFIVIHD